MYVDKEFWAETCRLKARSGLKLTQHAFERWQKRVDPRATRASAKAALARSLEVPEEFWPYFGLGGADRSDAVLWAPDVETRSISGVLFVVRNGRVVTCLVPRRPGHRTLLLRQVHQTEHTAVVEAYVADYAVSGSSK